MKKANIVTPIIKDKDKALVEKRKENRETSPGKIVLPGGHVEENESLKEACKRELKEELNIECDEFEPIDKRYYSLETEDQLVHYFLCKNWQGNVECREAQEVFWIDSTELEELDYPEEVEVLEEHLKQ